MEERRSDVPGFSGTASQESERKIWQTPVLSVVEVGDVTLGANSYASDGLDGS